MGAYDVGANKVMGCSFDRKRHQEFLRFLRWLRAKYPDGEKIYVIADNLSTHLHARVKRWARENDVHFSFTPTNASWLNPIEAHFGGISEFVIKGSDYQDKTELRRDIQKYLRWRNANPSDKGIKKTQKKHQLYETGH
jgi:transposase